MSMVIEKDVREIKNIVFKVFDKKRIEHIERIGGMTNRTYKVKPENEKNYVIRLPGEGTEKLINRAHEKISTYLASNLGIDAEIIYFGDFGEKVTHHIEGAKTLDKDSFGNEEVIKKAAEIFRIIHGCGFDTKIKFEVFDMASEYEKIIAENKAELFEDYFEIKEKIAGIKNFLESNVSVPGVPCHNDPLCENWVLDKDGRLYLVDWEYAGMNDPMWDLADLSVEAEFVNGQEKVLLKSYLGKEPGKEDLIRFGANKLYLDFLWSLWGKARAPFGGEKMEEYAAERYKRLKKNLNEFLKDFSYIK